MFTDGGLTVVSLVPERCRMVIRMCGKMPRHSDAHVGICWQISVNELTVVCRIGCVTSVCHVYSFDDASILQVDTYITIF